MNIIVKFRIAGTHCWPEAPAHRSYLREHHRHQFGFVVEMCVDHDDRDTEFHDAIDAFKAGIAHLYPGGPATADLVHFGRDSCEAIARSLMVWAIRTKRPVHAIEVWEDDECGARVERVEVERS